MTSLTDFRYLEEEHIKYCYDGATGIAKLPLNAVYADGVRDPSRPTTGSLPNGDKFNASTSYKRLLSFFTSTSISPDKLRAMGYKKLEALLSEVFMFVSERESYVLDCESKGPAFNSNKMHCGGFFETIIVELSRYLFHPGVQGTSKLSGGGGGYNLCNKNFL